MSATEASNLVKDMRDDGSRGSEASAHSKKTRTSQGASSRLSARSERLSLRKHEAALKAKQSFEDENWKLLQQEAEAEKVYRQRRIALQQQLDQEEIAFKQQQKELAMRKVRLATSEKLAQMKAMKHVLEEFEDEELSEHDSEISFKGLREEAKSEGMQRFFDSQEKTLTKPHQPEETEVHQRTDTVPPLSSLGVPAGWDKIASSLEGCLTQLTRVAMGQSAASTQLAATGQLPKIDVPVFNGDPLHYPLWKNSFDSMVDSKPISDSSKLNYLNTYVCGKAKEIIEHHLLLGADNGYQEARRQLEERFGNPSTISVSYTKKLCSWPNIENRDASGLRDFSDFLQKVLSAKAKVKNLGILDFPQENVKLVAKLPEYLEGRWRDEIDRWRESKSPQSYPPFSRFADFVKRAADRANIPELQYLTPESDRYTASKNRQSENRRAHNFSTSGDVDHHTSGQITEPHHVYRSCPFCDESHHIEVCERFLRKPMAERRRFFWRRMLCFGCALTDEHRSRDCRNKRLCSICDGRHLTCLHEDRSEQHTEDQGIPDQGARHEQ